MEMMMDDVGDVDIPEGMDPDDARVAIKLLYGADQTYRSALRDFATYESMESPFDTCSEKMHHEINALGTSTTRRKRLRRSGNHNRIGETRSGRITHLHVTGISSIFLPSWDLSFDDVGKLDGLVCLKLNGCDSVPSEVFFELPNLKRLSLINCQELTDPVSVIASHQQRSKNIHNKCISSTIEQLDIREGGLWGFEFLSALRLLFPYISSTLTSLSLSHTPYASCYNNKYATEESPMYSDSVPEESERVSEQVWQQQMEKKLLQQRLFHESMGRIMLDGLLSLASGKDKDNSIRDSTGESPLAYLGLSFFDSLLDKDVASLLLDVLPAFPRLTTLHLPHHTISNLKLVSRRISDQQTEFQSRPEQVLSSSPHIVRSFCLSWSMGTSTEHSTSIASISRLRRLWLKPTLKHSATDNHDSNHPNSQANNQHEKDILLPLLAHFPELGCVARSSNYKGYLYSPCPCCCGSAGSPQDSEQDQTIEYLLRMNHSGRCLLEGRTDALPLPSLWPYVLERAWKVPPPDFCAAWSGPASNASAIYRLVREGTIFSHHHHQQQQQ